MPRGEREILIAVCGLTPQVVTETLYWLAQVRRPAARISEIWILTTGPGKATAELALLDPRRGRFFEYCREYAIDARGIRFGPEQVIAIPGEDGRPLEDIRTPQDNLALADLVLDFVRRQTSVPSTVLHCSVAGGRKTMGLYLGLALQLYGRPGDTLSHVLVSPPQLESDPGFYYPPRKPGWLLARGKRLHTRDVKVELAQVPLLMLRGKLPALEEREGSYSALVRRAQEDYALLTAPPRAIVEPHGLRIVVGERVARLSPLEMALYLIFVEARVKRCGTRGCPGCLRCTLAASDFLGEGGVHILRSAIARVKSRDERLTQLTGWADPKDSESRFRQVRSRLNRRIARGLGGEAWPGSYMISSMRLTGEDRVRYGIRLDPGLLVLR